MGLEENELKPYKEPPKDILDTKRIGKTTVPVLVHSNNAVHLFLPFFLVSYCDVCTIITLFLPIFFWCLLNYTLLYLDLYINKQSAPL